MTRRPPPLVLLVPAAGAAVLLGVPLLALLLETPWTRIGALLAGDTVQAALWLSLRTSLAAVALSVVLGVPLACLLAGAPPRLRAPLRALVLVPLVLPPVVGGVGLLLAFGRRGLLGPLLVEAGAVPAFTAYGVVLATTFVAMPFLVLVVEGAVSGADPRYAEIAASLGAGRVRALVTVVLPMVAPSVAAGAALAWARALGEFGATITFAGSFPGRTQTLPLAVYELLVDDPPAAYAASALLLGLSVVLVLAVTGRVRLRR